MPNSSDIPPDTQRPPNKNPENPDATNTNDTLDKTLK
jgi:hypothetical protein